MFYLSAIYERVKSRCGGALTPEAILPVPDMDLREAGLSNAKVAYIKDLAGKVMAGELHLDSFRGMADDEVLIELMKVKGVGKWTAEMFMIFSLGRPDILSLGDAGIQRAIKWLYGLEGNMDAAFLKSCSHNWAPYRTAASLYVWSAINKGYVGSYPSFEGMLPVKPN